MLRLFCLYPWLFIWPWLFGVAAASFIEGRVMCWTCPLLYIEAPLFRWSSFFCMLGMLTGMIRLPLAWQDLSIQAYIYRVERLTPRIEMISSEWAERLQDEGRKRFRSVLPAREAVLAAAMLYGDAAFSKEDLIKIRAVGLAHLVAVSGANILFLLIMVRFVTHRAIRQARARFYVDVLGIVLIVLMTGASTSVVRGGLMLVIFGGARFFGRKGSFGRTLLLSGACLVLVEPRRLLFDAGYLLSFFACIGLLHASQPNKDPVILETLSLRASWYTWIWTAPFQVWFFGSVSWLGLFTNMLVLFIVPWIQALALLVWFVPIRILAFPLRFCLQYLWLVIDWASPWSRPLQLEAGYAFLFMIVSYLVLMSRLIHKRVGYWRVTKSSLVDMSFVQSAWWQVRWAFWMPILIDGCPDLLIEAGASMLKTSASDRRETLLRTRLEDLSRSR